MEDTTPILVGCGQLTRRDTGRAGDPIAMMAEAAGLAAADAGLGTAALARLDRLALVRAHSCTAADPAARLGEILGATAARGSVTAGGTAPQRLVSAIMGDIAQGTCRLALVVGAEALAGGGAPMALTEGIGAAEAAHGLDRATLVYALLENALRARRGRSQRAHLRRIGALYAPFTEVAAASPLAWHRRPYSAAELATPGPGNRFVGYPYTHRLTAATAVDQAAALLLTSVAEARRLGLAESLWIHLHGHAAGRDPTPLAARPALYAAPAIRAVGQAALAMAGRSIAQVDLVDLHAWAPSAVQIAKDALALPEVDGPPLTVTGGLAYFGAPGDNYTTHAIATMMTRLRAAPGQVGLVTSESGALASHAVGLYAAARPSAPFRAADDTCQAGLDAAPCMALAAAPEGRARIESYTVRHDPDGAPAAGIVIGRLVDDGRRFVAATPTAPAALDALLDGEAVGRRGRVATAASGVLFTPD